jgi:2-dehydropantoate 2-reductase
LEADDSLLILGTGAMACLFGARLAAAGERVTFLGTWGDGLEALQGNGVCIIDADGAEHVYPVLATSDPADCRGASLALVLVKSWQTERAARQLAECLEADGVALTLQNGLGNREKLAFTLGADRVALGVTTTGATLAGPGRVRPGGDGVVYLEADARLKPLVKLLQRVGVQVELKPQMDSVMWGKLTANAAINPLSALLRVPNGELLASASARALLGSAAGEVAAVAAALGRTLDHPDPVAMVESVARRTATNTSSMLQDVLRGAPTEIDFICGAIVNAGEKCGVPTPTNRVLWLLVKALAEKAE